MSKEIELLKHEVENLKSGESRAATVVIGLPRSCNEIKEFNPNLTYGEYIIDPDGIHVGFDPVTVLCDEKGNFTTKITIISLHKIFEIIFFINKEQPI